MKVDLKREIGSKLFNDLRDVLSYKSYAKILELYYKLRHKTYEKYELSSDIRNHKGKDDYIVFRFDKCGIGILGIVRCALIMCERAEKEKLTPLIDFEFRVDYQNKGLFCDNAWEYVFQQPCGVSNVSTSTDGNYFVSQIGYTGGSYSDKKQRKEVFGISDAFFPTIHPEGWRAYYKNLSTYMRKWIHLRPEIEKQYHEKFEKIFCDRIGVLGVAFREEFSIYHDGNDDGSVLSKHPHHLPNNKKYAVVEEYMKKSACTYLFVTTAFQDTIDDLTEIFGDRLLYIDRKRQLFSTFKKRRMELGDGIMEAKDNPIEQYHTFADPKGKYYGLIDFSREGMIDYVGEIYLLSKCDYLFADNSTGSIVALMWNGGKYKDVKFQQVSSNQKGMTVY